MAYVLSILEISCGTSQKVCQITLHFWDFAQKTKGYSSKNPYFCKE